MSLPEPIRAPFPDDRKIRTRPRPECHVCGSTGEPLYAGLLDRLYGAPGEWSVRRCPEPGCGLLWLDPAPLEEDIGEAYRSYYTHEAPPSPPRTALRRTYRAAVRAHQARRFGYEGPGAASGPGLLALALALHPPRAADADFEVMYLPARSGGALLDVGCGSGAFLQRMAGLGWRVEGVDFDRGAVERARRSGLSVRQGTLEEQAYPDASFDAVTMSHLIEHVFDPRALLRECRRILRPGGRLVAVTPNAASWGRGRFGPNWRGLEPPRHIHVFTPGALLRLAREAGFEAVTARTTIRDAHGIFAQSRLLERAGPGRIDPFRPVSVRIRARAMQWAEWLLLRVRPDLGEEIALAAVR